MWRAFDLMIDRLMTREVHGGEKLEEKQFMQGFNRRLVHGHPVSSADDYIIAPRRWRAGADPRTDISADQGVRPRGLPPRGRPRDPGVGRGRASPATCRSQACIRARRTAPPGGRAGRGAPDSHGEADPAPLPHSGETWDFGKLTRTRPRVPPAHRPMARSGGVMTWL